MTEISIFVQLKTTSPLPKEEAMSWYRCVKNNLPSGLLSSVQTTDPNGDPDVVFMIHKETKGGAHFYVIPLSRDLTEQETEVLEQAWPEGEIQTSSQDIQDARKGPTDAIVMDSNQYNQLCEALAKHQHQQWYNARTSAGWSFGLLVNEKARQHPMIRPWEDLPEKYKKVDYELPHLFMDMLAQHGFVVVGRQELNKWIEKSQ